MNKPNIAIRINKPCSEDWDQMTPTQQGKFCGACQKNVIDFSTMTDNEILDFLSEHTGSLCGQWRGSQLNRVIKQTKLTGSNWKLNSFVTALMLAGSAGLATAQSTPPKTNQTVIIDEKHPTGPVCIRVPETTTPQTLVAVVYDTINASPVAYARVQIAGTNTYAQADENGKFTLVIPSGTVTETITLLITAVGYRRQQYILPINSVGSVNKIEVGFEEIMMKGDSIIEIRPRKCGND